MKVRRLYDWAKRWKILRPQRCKEPRHEIVIFDNKVLAEMLRLGYLKGQALVDASALAGPPDTVDGGSESDVVTHSDTDGPCDDTDNFSRGVKKTGSGGSR